MKTIGAAILMMAVLMPSPLRAEDPGDPWEKLVAALGSPVLEQREAAARDLQAHMDRLRKDDPAGFLEGLERLEALRGATPDIEIRDRATKVLDQYRNGGGMNDPYRGGGVLWRRGPDEMPGRVSWLCADGERLIAVGQTPGGARAPSWIGAYDRHTGEPLWVEEVQGLAVLRTIGFVQEGLLCGGFYDKDGTPKGWAAVHDLATGKPKNSWKDLPGPAAAAATCDGGIVVAGIHGVGFNRGGWIAHFDIAAGKKSWIHENLPGHVLALAASGPEIVVGGTMPPAPGGDEESGPGWAASFSVASRAVPAWIRENLPTRVDALTIACGRVLASGMHYSMKGGGPSGWAALFEGKTGRSAWERTSDVTRPWDSVKPQDGLLPGGAHVSGKLPDGRLYLGGWAWRSNPPVGAGVSRDRGWLWIFPADGNDAGRIDLGEMPGPVRSIDRLAGEFVAGGGSTEAGVVGHVAGWLARFQGTAVGKLTKAWEKTLPDPVRRIDLSADMKTIAVSHDHHVNVVHGISLFEAGSGNPLWEKVIRGREGTDQLWHKFGLARDVDVGSFSVIDVQIRGDRVLAGGSLGSGGWLGAFRLRDEIPAKYPVVGEKSR